MWGLIHLITCRPSMLHQPMAYKHVSLNHKRPASYSVSLLFSLQIQQTQAFLTQMCQLLSCLDGINQLTFLLVRAGRKGCPLNHLL